MYKIQIIPLLCLLCVFCFFQKTKSNQQNTQKLQSQIHLIQIKNHLNDNHNHNENDNDNDNHNQNPHNHNHHNHNHNNDYNHIYNHNHTNNNNNNNHHHHNRKNNLKHKNFGQKLYKNAPWSQQDIYFYGMLSGIIVSSIGFFAALFVQAIALTNTFLYTLIVSFLFAFSCSALINQTILHILPQAYISTPHQTIGIIFSFSIFFFLGLQRLFDKLSIGHSHALPTTDKKTDKPTTTVNEIKSTVAHTAAESRTRGYLNLFSSLLHNFIDGLAIGVAYSRGNPDEFIGVTLGIIAHEVPRQMGDVAVLLRSNFSNKEVILSNGIVNCISLVGVWLGFGTSILPTHMQQYILIFIAGNFIYIASDIWKGLWINRRSVITVAELFGLAVGFITTVHHSH